MNEAHEHDWSCYSEGSVWLICSAPDCQTMVRIDDLLKKTQAHAKNEGDYAALTRLMKEHLLSPKGRKAVNKQLNEHPLSRERELEEPFQIRLWPYTHPVMKKVVTETS